MRVWIETGGDTGSGEVYTDPESIKVGGVDWDDWNDSGWDQFDELFNWLEEFGDVMPKRTRAELLTRLQPDEEMKP